MQQHQILIVSNPEDEHTKIVLTKLQDLGVNPLLFYPETLGQKQDYVLNIDNSLLEPIQTLSFLHKEVNLDHISAVWYRRPRPVRLDQCELSQEGLAFAREEWRATIEAMYASLNHCLWVSHPDLLRRAARKPLQLSIARQLGFTIPKTLITNKAEEALRFCEQIKGSVIVKAAGNGWVYSPDGKEISYVLTNRLRPDDLTSLDTLKYAPVVFQEEIPKAFEVRVNIVGQQIHAIRIESQKSPISQVDWRKYDVKNTPYLPYTLPLRVERQCLDLTRKFGLEFGAIDLICTPDEDFVFLEINGNGQFLWAEHLSGVRISDALALLLAGISPTLKSIGEKGGENCGN